MKVTSLKKLTKSDINFDDVKQWYDKNMSLDVIDLDDQKVYEFVYHDARWAGIFQCIEKDSLIQLSDNTRKKISDIEVGEQVKTFDIHKNEFIDSEVVNVFDKGIKKCIDLVLENGEKLTCTLDHKILTSNRGWVCAGLLTCDDDIITI